MILFSRIPIMYEGVSGVASSRALTASTPCSVGYRECIIKVRYSREHIVSPMCGRVHKVCPRVAYVRAW